MVEATLRTCSRPRSFKTYHFATLLSLLLLRSLFLKRVDGFSLSGAFEKLKRPSNGLLLYCATSDAK